MSPIHYIKKKDSYSQGKESATGGGDGETLQSFPDGIMFSTDIMFSVDLKKGQGTKKQLLLLRCGSPSMMTSSLTLWQIQGPLTFHTQKTTAFEEFVTHALDIVLMTFLS